MLTSDVWSPRHGHVARIVGAGSYVAPHVITAAQIAQAIPGWNAAQILERTGIVERRYLWPLDVERGCAAMTPGLARCQPVCATDMAEAALAGALRMSGVRASEIDVLVVVTCTPDQPRFSHDAMDLQRRLGLRRGAHAFTIDSGCGGSLYVLDMLVRMLDAASIRTVAVVGTNLSSPLLDRTVYSQEGPKSEEGKTISPYLSAYVFGDGAGAIVARLDDAPSLGVRASTAGNDHSELVRVPGGGTTSPSYGERYRALDHAFIVNGRLVASTYIKTMRHCVAAVADHVGHPLEEIERFYLHQPNERILGVLAAQLGLHAEQLASNVAYVGNTSSAGMFMLLADDLERGRVKLGGGTPVVFAAIGAGVHYGAQLVYL